MDRPTANSPELLVRTLSIYPIFESLLTHSHRPDIVHLARTSKALRGVLKSQIPRLLTLFHSCHKGIRSCELCNTPVCQDCVVKTSRPVNRGLRWGSVEYVLVGGRRVALRQEIVSQLQSMGSYLDCEPRVAYQDRKPLYACHACYSQRPARGSLRDWLTQKMVDRAYQRNNITARYSSGRFVNCPHLKAKHIPHIKRTCSCNAIEAGCKVSPHIVPVDSLPMGSELVGMVAYDQLSRQVRVELAGHYDKGTEIPFYILP